MRLFQRLKAAWLFSRTYQYRDLYDGYWTLADAGKLGNFFNDTSGLKLKQILTNSVIEQQMNACSPNTREPEFQRGIPYGMRLIIAQIESRMKLSQATADSGNIQEPQSKGAEALAHLAP